MIVARDLPALREALADLPRPVSLVPTMGALHAGHVALVEAARARSAAVVVSIFVNPLQFAATEDLDRYPRDTDADLALLAAAGCDLVWLPAVEAVYPPGDATTVDVGGPALGYEGAARPGHFRGVATVVAKLFCQVGPDLAAFGEKDWQQLQVVRRMTSDLGMAIRILPVATVRETNGLALSSRNRLLSPEDLAKGFALHAVLRRVAGGMAPEMAPHPLLNAGLMPEYCAIVDAETMGLPGLGPRRVVAAARLGGVRLIDNMAMPPVRP